MQSRFVRDPENYKRDIDFVKNYRDQMGFFIEKMTGDDPDLIKQFLQEGIYQSGFPNTRNPTVEHYERDRETKDTFETKTSLTEYYKKIDKDKLIVVPSGTSYLPRNVEVSLIAESITETKDQRSLAKKDMFKAKAAGNEDLENEKKVDQKKLKLDTNTFSGIYNTKGNVMSNPTGHSSLTSTIRLMTSIGNTNNERLMAGNRQYYKPLIISSNLIFLSQSLHRNNNGYIPYDFVKEALELYNLYVPTIDDVLDVIDYSSRLYFRDKQPRNFFKSIVEKLDDVERSYFVYSGDLYHLRIYNPDFVRNFLDQLTKKFTDCEVEDRFSVVQESDDEVMDLTHKIYFNHVKGFGKDYKRMEKNDEKLVHNIAATATHIDNINVKYEPLLLAFFKTDNIPPTVSHIPKMVRRVVVMSDTDSTAASADEWIKWYNGKIEFNEVTRALACSVHYFSTQVLKNYLATMSANLGVADYHIFKLAMKSEFYWEVFAATDVSKTYFARPYIQEGNVYKEPDLEIKGVNLKNSNIPPSINKFGRDLMIDILDTVGDNKKLNMKKILTKVADMEREIERSLLAGELEFYRKIELKSADTYKLNVEKSNYRYHTFWEEVWAPKYTTPVRIPYKVAKINVTTDNKQKLNAWVDGLTDEELKKRLAIWIKKNQRNDLCTLYFPVDHLQTYGLPVEIINIIDVNGITQDLVNNLYIILSALAFQKKTAYTIKELGY